MIYFFYAVFKDVVGFLICGGWLETLLALCNYFSGLCVNCGEKIENAIKAVELCCVGRSALRSTAYCLR